MSDIAEYSDQPPPQEVEGVVSAHDLVVADLYGLASVQPAGDLMAGIESIVARKEFGLKKYGVVLHKDNGRDYFKDVDDEAGDLPVYMKVLMEKYPDLTPRVLDDYYAALGIMIRMHALALEYSERT